MAIRQIRTLGDPVLTKVCRKVEKMTPRTKQLIDDMLETMYDANGVGLAAPQVTYIMQTLRERGLKVRTDVTTLEEAEREILKALGSE